MREKLFRLLFQGKHRGMVFLENHARRLAQAVQRKEAEIQTLKSKIRRLERGK